MALVFGTESTGVSNELLAACDRRVYVPQHGFADSLNVGVAAALATSRAVHKSNCRGASRIMTSTPSTRPLLDGVALWSIAARSSQQVRVLA